MFIRSIVLFLLLGLPLAAEEVQGLLLPFKSVLVASPVTAQTVIENMAVEEGTSVKKDEVLVEMRHAIEDLAVAEAEQIVINTEFVAKGMMALLNDKYGAKDAALKAETEWKLAKIRLATQKEFLSEKFVKSPLDGIVVKKFKETGESVDRGEKMLELVNIDQLYAQFYLDPKYLQTLVENQPITIRVPEVKGFSVVGRISFIDVRIDATSGLFRTKVLFENKDRKVKAGMKAMADFSKKG